MCGLIGALAQRNVTPILLEGLRRLEYRGYDSAGLAYLDGEGAIGLHRSVGSVADLETLLNRRMPGGAVGIGHTRWATHGEPDERNAHPHLSCGEIAVVHNGIIENHESLRKMLELVGYDFQSDTDSEVVAHLVHYHYAAAGDLLGAVRTASRQLSGSYAIAVMTAREPDTLVAARHGSPLVIGLGADGRYIASDATALLPLTDRVLFLENGDVARVRSDDLSILDHEDRPARRAARTLDIKLSAAEKGPYRHYMLKEIHDQPDALSATLQACVEDGPGSLESIEGMLPARIAAVHIVACGTSHHAGEIARYWLEQDAGIPCMVDLASEYCYRSPVVPPDCLFLALSQSGETADTLAALRHAKRSGYGATLSICNVANSSLVHESDGCLLTRAGPEIGVASTKSFTTQLLCLRLLVSVLQRRRVGGRGADRELIERLGGLAAQAEAALELNGRIRMLARAFAEHTSALFLGRGSFYPLAKEGALKLKEVSYIHAEAHAAGELKHGPLALVDPHMPIVVLAPDDSLLGKLRSNLHEVRARKGYLHIIADAGADLEAGPRMKLLRLPPADALAAPFLHAIAVQLLAYHVAVLRGTSVDRPRNLAKSVTVE